MLRSIYGQQVFPFYDWSKNDYFEQYWDLLHNFSYEVIEDFFLSIMEKFTIDDEEKKELILKLKELNEEYPLDLLRDFEGDVNVIWRDFFFHLWNSIKTSEDLRQLVCPHHSLPQDFPEREEVQLILNLKVEENKNVRLELQNFKRVRRDD